VPSFKRLRMDQHGRRGQHRAALARNVMEWYDFSVYGYFAAIIGRHFFPTGDRTTSLIAAFGVFAAGFFMRPLGSTRGISHRVEDDTAAHRTQHRLRGQLLHVFRLCHHLHPTGRQHCSIDGSRHQYRRDAGVIGVDSAARRIVRPCRPQTHIDCGDGGCSYWRGRCSGCCTTPKSRWFFQLRSDLPYW
jgi:hypothetical protein